MGFDGFQDGLSVAQFVGGASPIFLGLCGEVSNPCPGGMSSGSQEARSQHSCDLCTYNICAVVCCLRV